MSTIIRNRTIRPSSRIETSKSYQIDTKNVTSTDTLIVNIHHESKPFKESYTFSGPDVNIKDSISFRVVDYGTHFNISWTGAQPSGSPSRKAKSKKEMDFMDKAHRQMKINSRVIVGLAAIVDSSSKILILGTMPGIESLRKQEYYGHSRNMLWKMIAHITGKEIPEQYEEKLKLLNAVGIALWDVCMTCIRKGSLDSNIQDETPNDLLALIEKYPNIKALAFNGKGAARLFGKHIGSIEGIRLISLPSTSPANASIPMKTKIEA